MELLAKIKTSADLTALKETLQVNKDLRKTFADLGQSTAELDQQIRAMESALGSEQAKAIGAIEAMEKHAKALRQNGQDAGKVEAKIAGLRKQMGLKGPSFAATAGRELAALANDIPGVGRVVSALTNIFGASRTMLLAWAAASWRRGWSRSRACGRSWATSSVTPSRGSEI